MPPLDPDAVAFLERLQGAPPLTSLTPQQVRDAHVAGSPSVSGPGADVEGVHDDVVAGVPVRVYPGGSGTTVCLHGGGWVVGTLDTYDGVCRDLAAASGTTVVSVGYDLAPEVRHPVQVAQAVAVLQAQQGPVALAGDSAGAHLAVLAAVRAGVPLTALALVYPVVSPALDTPSARENGTGYALETEGMRWYWEQYLPEEPTDVPVDLLQLDLSGLPRTLVLTAGYDPLRDEGLALADALEAAGVDVTRLPYDGQLHGFFRTDAVIGQSAEARRRVADFLRGHTG
ncbi:MAG: hydrolase [Frankiales bacterium]|nr:hydrolase [Frankiales bacterium]